MKFGDYFKGLIQTVLGGIPFQEKDVGKSIDEIDERLNKTSYGNLFEMMVNLTNNKKMKENNRDENDQPLNLRDLIDVNDDYQDEIYDLFSRRQRYNAYRNIVKKISRLRRTIKVLRSNIISSDNLRNTLLHYRATAKGDFQKQIMEVQERFKYLKINSHTVLSRIIDTTLHYGDFFIEIATKKNLLRKFETKEKLLESGYLKQATVEDEEIEFQRDGKTIKKRVRFQCSLEKNVFSTSILESKGSEENKDDTITLDDIQIFYHRPHNVIKLTLGDQVYGYLILPENLLKTKMIFQNVNMLKTDTATTTNDGVSQYGVDLIYTQKATERSVKIIRNILEFLKKNIHSDIVEENPALKSVITKLVYSGVYSVGSLDQFNELLDEVDHIKIANLPLRFVDVSKMQEFCLNRDEYDPYGTSIFDDVLFDAKLLISDKITSTIERITKSIERRMISFESDDRNSMSMIQILKEKFRKKKALFDGNTTFDNIPSILSPFEEYYIPMKGGNPYITFSSEAPTSQHSARVDDLKFLRDEITSNMNVPPAYIGLEENIESKATLFLQNILFSIEILDYQEMFSNNLTELSDKIGRILDSAHIGLVKVGFALPVILSSASELEHISTVSGVKDYLLEIGMTNEDVRERYMPFLNEYFTNQSKTARKMSSLEHGREGKEEEGGPGF